MTIRRWTIEVGRRSDGDPWRIHAMTVTSSRPGPSTAFVSGIYGDKPLGCQAIVDLARHVESEAGPAGSLRGEVHLIAAANPPALEAGTRANPDGFLLNRRFPGSPEGALTDQLAHALVEALVSRADCVVDVHSGTPTMGLWYSYDFGDVELSASFGHVPVIVGFGQVGQLSHALRERGCRSFLVEFGGGVAADPTVGVDGCCNVLRYRGQLGGSRSGPARVPRITGRDLSLASANGALWGRYGTDAVGRPVPAGPLAEIRAVSTGEVMQSFAVAREGGRLLMSVTSPAMVSPGAYVAMVGFGDGELEVPVA